MNFYCGKARRWNGAGTMTEEQRSQNRNSSGTLAGHVVHFSTPQQQSIVSTVLRSGIMGKGQDKPSHSRSDLDTS